MLYRLNEDLKKAGHESEIRLFGHNEPVPDDVIVIYPEVVSKNPLNAKKVVRYILGHYWDKTYDMGDFFLAYNDPLVQYIPAFWPSAEAGILTVPFMEEFFRYDGREKITPAVYWVGKGGDQPRIAVTNNLSQITSSWPPTREEFAELLKSTAVLYTYDDFTAVADEAKYAGCQVILIKDGKEIDYPFVTACQNFKGYTINWYEVQLNRFLKEVEEWSQSK